MTVPQPPNIIVFFADDLGIGDLGCYNPDSRIPTPHLDAVAAQGRRFTDAHAGSAVCTPSRYTLLTGRHPARSRLDGVVLFAFDEPLIEPELPTVAGALSEQGYRSTCLGKWHLGWDWTTKDGTRPNDTLTYASRSPEREAYHENIDFAAPVAGGPTARGFDHYFGPDVANNPPFTWFEDDRLVVAPSEMKPADMWGRPGPMAPGWRHEDILPELTRRAVDEIDRAAESGQPLFLYYALTSPHTPIAPNEEFLGSSGIGVYGDFVVETDHVIGEVLAALERTGLADNTLVLISSDNGPEGWTPQDPGAYQRLVDTGHASMGEWRGIKRDGWEGGHRIPLIAHWPGHIEPGTVCDVPVSLGDLFATCAELVGFDLPPEAMDSVSMLSLLTGSTTPHRTFLMSRTSRCQEVIRAGDWVYIDGLPENSPEPEEVRMLRSLPDLGEEVAALYNLADDPMQRTNLIGSRPDKVRELRALIKRVLDEPELQVAGAPTPDGGVR